VRNPFALAAIATAIALLIAGCGSNGSSSSTTTAAAPAASVSTPATPATTSTSTAGTGAGMMVATKHGKLGTILAAGPKHLTVYLFEADKGPSSSCSGVCAKAWPPVTTDGAPTAAGSAVAADLGTIARPDGSKQVTYKGHPLYFFEKDGDSGDAYGQGSTAFGAGWYVLSPTGSKVDNS
jgi:predicted lipoprotein with Yx(FWY)xxD motif